VTPRIPLVNRLNDVNSEPRLLRILSGRSLPSYPSLRLSQILKLIKNGSAEAVTIIEWMGLFRDDLGLDDEHSLNASALLWQAISQSERISRIALFMAALKIEGQQAKFPIELMNTLDIVKPFMIGVKLQRVNWLVALRDLDTIACVEMSFQAKISPFNLALKIGMPSPNKFRDLLLEPILTFIPNSPKDEDIDWLYDCLNDMTRSEEISFCNKLLLEFSSLLPFLETWLSQKSLPDSINTIWFEIDHHSRKLLKFHFKLSSFHAFSSLIDKICSPNIAAKLELDDRDLRQLKSRTQFWSNYSEKINQSKLLLPKSTENALRLNSAETAIEIIILPNLAEENSEVFIFEVENQLLVEVLRGDASELRIFEATQRNKNRLLRDQDLTLKKIRLMSCSNIQDHVKLWQYFSEQMLRTQFDIAPNDDIQFFQGIDKDFASYKTGKGLVKPSAQAINQRLDQLESWESAFWAREARLNGIIDIVSAINSSKYVKQAKISKLKGHMKNFVMYMELAVEANNPEAHYLLGIHFLTETISSYKLTNNYKQTGEKLLIKSASLNYSPAIKIAEKFKLKYEINEGLKDLNKVARVNPLNKESLNVGYEETPRLSTKKPALVRNYTKLELKTAITKVSNKSTRPYVSLYIDDLECIAGECISEAKVFDELVSELEKRTQNKRVVRLLDWLASLPR
jgi:hypothetical protein